jgi:hypothetical protein
MEECMADQPECEHKYQYKGTHVEGKEHGSTSVSWKTVYDVYFCEKCLEEKRKEITSGYQIKVPANATASGYGFEG